MIVLVRVVEGHVKRFVDRGLSGGDDGHHTDVFVILINDCDGYFQCIKSSSSAVSKMFDE